MQIIDHVLDVSNNLCIHRNLLHNHRSLCHILHSLRSLRSRQTCSFCHNPHILRKSSHEKRTSQGNIQIDMIRILDDSWFVTQFAQ